MTHSVAAAAILMTLVAAPISCRLRTEESSVKQTDSNDYPSFCIGGRHIDDRAPYGFNFNATHADLNNAYWSSVASAVAYQNGAITRSFFYKIAQFEQPSFKFYGMGKDEVGETTSTQAFLASFKNGSILSFRGTAETVDLVVDANVTQTFGKAFDENYQLSDLAVHKGFSLSLDAVWERVVDDLHTSATPQTLDLKIPEQFDAAFTQIDAALSGLIQAADVDHYRPDVAFEMGIDELLVHKIIKATAKLSQLKGVINIWAESAQLIQEALIHAKGNESDASYVSILQKQTERRRKNIARIHEWWNYRSYRPIWLTGHSLGGALATVAAFRLTNLGIPVSGLITFGSPKVGNDVFASYLERRLKSQKALFSSMRFQFENDGVTRVPITKRWKHVGRPFYVLADGHMHFPLQGENQDQFGARYNPFARSNNISTYETELPADFKGLWTFNLFKAVTDHSVTNAYLSSIESALYGNNAECL